MKAARTLTVAAAALVLALFGGCAPKGDIKIGALLPLTGDGASYGEAISGAVNLAVDAVNAKGGIGGRKLVVIYEDTQINPEMAVSAARKLIDVDKVSVIVGPLSSTEAMAVAPIAEQNKVILISPSATSSDFSRAGDYVFRTIVSDVYDGTAMADYASGKGYKKVGVVYQNDAGPKGVADAFIAKFKLLGGEVPYSDGAAPGAKDYRTQIARLKAANVDAVYFALYLKESESFVRQVRELKLDKQLLTHQLIDDPVVLGRLGKAADGIIFTSPKLTPETGNPGVKAFYALYKAKFGKDPLQFTANSYDAAMLIIKAIEAKAPAADGIKTWLYAVKDYDGASGTLSFDANGDVQQKMLIMRVEGGKAITAD